MSDLKSDHQSLRLPSEQQRHDQQHQAGDANASTPLKRPLNSILFVRHRMLYGKPVGNTKSGVCFGLHRTHIFQRSGTSLHESNPVHLMKYMFPLQFGLHNVFSSTADPKQSGQMFKDYTMREQEIKRAMLQSPRSASKLPKRLRGGAQRLTETIRFRHARCSYLALIQHYCPATSHGYGTSSPAADCDNVLSLATPSAQVSAWCQSVVNKVFPSTCWGSDDIGHHNKSVMMRNVDRFVKMGRYESMTLHDVLQDISVSRISWLAGSDSRCQAKLAASDFGKRKEMLGEFVYFLFDSFLIPLISSNFHVTESSARRNELSFFRHDVWKRLSEPALTELRTTKLEELSSSAMKRLGSRRSLGSSRIRLLPKENGMRPIINLRRRLVSRFNGAKVLTRSINSILAPAFNVLNFEKVGCALF